MSYTIDGTKRFESSFLTAPPMVCVTHVRWMIEPDDCYTPETKYDSKNKKHQPTSDPKCIEILRRFHNGEIDRETAWKQIVEQYNG